MVLPASAPDAQPVAAVAPWAERVSKILHLVERGILVLVDQADDAQLGPLIRALCAEHRNLEVFTDATRCKDAPHGSVIVLATRPEDADWLNLARPIFADRALRVVLWSRAEVTAGLATRAPDFFDWIARRVACPSGPPGHAVAGLRAALCARAWAVDWQGSALDEAFVAALPGRSIVRASAAMPYDGLIATARSAGRAWIAWSNVDDARSLWRLRWALAETGRRGRNILDNPRAEPLTASAAPRLALVDLGTVHAASWPVHAATAELGAAAHTLASAGAASAGRLAALLDLEPEAIALAAGALTRGVSPAEIEAALLGAADPGAALAKLTCTHVAPQDVARCVVSPPLLRAFSTDPRVRRARTELRKAQESFGALMLRPDWVDPEEAAQTEAQAEAVLRLHPGRATWAALARFALRLGERDVAVRWGARGIDFEALERLDEEADALIREGRWTREEFARLWQAALAETGGDERWLEFLSYPAHPEWLPERPGSRASGSGYERVSRRVATLIHALQRGWSPRVVLSRAEIVRWNDERLPSARADVAWETGSARVSVTCGSSDTDRIEKTFQACEPGRVVRNAMRTEHAGGWRFESTNANVASLRLRLGQGEEQRSQIDVRALGWRAVKGQDLPLLWVAPLSHPVSIRLGNLRVIDNPLDVPLAGMYGRARGSWRLQGRYTYFLVEIRDRAAKRQVLIIEPPEGEDLDPEPLHRDMLALQFIWGEALQCPLLYGLRGGDVTACMGHHDERFSGARAPAISAHLEYFEYWIEPFFSRLSQALRDERTTRLAVPVEASLTARHHIIDDEARDLEAALTNFSYWTLRDTADAAGLLRRPKEGEAWIERFERALVALGIHLPREDLDEIALYQERLRTIGSLTEDIGRSDEEHERELRLVATLRTLLVAMVAASVGYRGVIRGIGHDEGPPAWWPVDPEQEKGIYHDYVAVTAPAPAQIPQLVPGEVLLLVEQRHHQTIVLELLHAAGCPVSRVRILAGGGRQGLRELVHATEGSPAVILAGSKQRDSLSAVDDLRHELGIQDRRTVLCAVPDIDAWLLADDALVRRHIGGDPELVAELAAMPLPEELADPFASAHRLLGPPECWGIVRGANVRHACMRSPSLCRFLSWMADALGVAIDLPRGG